MGAGSSVKIAVITGEASGDLLGANLIEHLQPLQPSMQLAGIGGERLQALGFDCWWHYQELTVFGLVEVLKHLRRLLRLRKQLLQRLLEWRPDIVITIDAPDFNLPLAAKLKQQGIPVIHYVCPSIWAWRQNRVHTLAKSVDHVLCLLPFERDFLHQHQVAATFVGHPVADQIAPQSAGQRTALQQQSKQNDSRPVIALLPGSRDSEITRLLPAFMQAAALLEQPVTLVTAVTKTSHQQLLEQQHQSFAAGIKLTVLHGPNAAQSALQMADAALLASGTVTLEAMLCNCPMVVAYRLHPLTWYILKWFKLYKASHVSLPNLLAGNSLVPEILQHAVTPAVLAEELKALLNNDQTELRAQFTRLSSRLRRNAGRRAAEVVNSLLKPA